MREDILQCYTQDTNITNQLDQAMSVIFQAGSDAKIEDVVDSIYSNLSGCAKIDQNVLAQWMQKVHYVWSRPDLPEFMGNVISSNAAAIQNYQNQTLMYWSTENFYDSGLNLGQIELIFDIASDNNPLALTDPLRDDSAPAQFAAGWFKGVSGVDMREEILKCFKESAELTKDLYEAMEAYISGDRKTGDEKMRESKSLWDTAMAGCG